ncbi:conserved hypothetical protein [Ricinus communis]|uniref:Reverse transcriptase zinc-binding domain-containing protein n=1 Tax=Ricinus communis TaxID=3988 RepID=B9T7J1_RICCO|nr:conserved hypothetical protein [Ricinus communis]
MVIDPLRVGKQCQEYYWGDPRVPSSLDFRIRYYWGTSYNVAKVSDFASPNISWNDNLSQALFPEHIQEAILKIPLGSLSMQDRPIWHYDHKEILTTKSNSSLSPKLKAFVWRMLRNCLATRVNLFIRKLLDSETSEHLFFFYNHARATWLASKCGIRTIMKEVVEAFVYKQEMDMKSLSSLALSDPFLLSGSLLTNFN